MLLFNKMDTWPTTIFCFVYVILLTFEMCNMINIILTPPLSTIWLWYKDCNQDMQD